MFAGDDDNDSVISFDPSAAAPPRSPANHWKVVQSAVFSSEADRISALRRASRAEAEFGWSGSAGGIRGRDDRQIERDTEFERQIEDRRRKRKERKMKDAGLADALNAAVTQGDSSHSSPFNTISSKSYRPVFAPDENALASVERKGTTATGDDPLSSSPGRRRKGVTLVDRPIMERSQSAGDAVPHVGDRTAPSNPALKRGMSLKDKVGAALGRWGSRRVGPPPSSAGRARAATTGGMGAVRESNASSEGDAAVPQQDGSSGGGGLTGLARKLSRKLADPAIEERRKRDLVYVEPPKLSHVLVGDRSPFPPRPPLVKTTSSGQSPPSFNTAMASGARAAGAGLGGYARAAYEKPTQVVA